MNFDLTLEQSAIVDTAAAFAREQMAPHAGRWDEDKHLPVDVLRAAAALGFAGIYVSEDVGGSNLGRVESVLVFEQLAMACPSTAGFLSIHNMASWMIDTWGTEQQRQTFLPQMVTYEKIASYCLTEPNAGSDAASLGTKAVLQEDTDSYLVNGSKSFISGGGFSDLYVTMVRTGQAGPKGISCLIAQKGMEGLSFGPHERKMGWSNQPTSQVFFEDCSVPVSHRLGDEGQGFSMAMAGLNGGRLNIAACSLGGARACLDIALEYVQSRSQFGKPLSTFQATEFKLADMATELDAARLMVLRAAYALDQKQADAPKYCAMAKRFATDVGFKVANEALQLLGGYGYLKEYAVERYVRDLRVHQILEGTNEIMRVIIAKSMLKT